MLDRISGQDYLTFLKVLEQARSKANCRLLFFCVMPNHWHLVLWPKGDEDPLEGLLLTMFRQLGVDQTESLKQNFPVATKCCAKCWPNTIDHSKHRRIIREDRRQTGEIHRLLAPFKTSHGEEKVRRTAAAEPLPYPAAKLGVATESFGGRLQTVSEV